MRRVSISELKAKLSQYLDLVAEGEEVMVTDHGRPVARLSGLSSGGDRASRLQELVRLGRVRPPLEERAEAPECRRPEDPTGRAVASLLDERHSGR